MSRLCAKPTCGETAVSWLDILRKERRVLEQARESTQGLALCLTHRDRFIVPEGWELQGHEVDGVITEPDAAPIAPQRSVVETDDERSGSRERPWFLVGAASDVPVRPLLDTDDDDQVDHGELAGGSLLRRAFQGPDRDDDRARRADTERDTESVDDDDRYELETERTIRALDEYGTAQLPFPTGRTEVQAAVS